MISWVTRPERPKNAKNEVKLEVGARRAPQLLVDNKELLSEPTTSRYTNGTFQAHIPTYILSWLTAIINPIIYVVCNPTYRESASKKLDCLASLSKFYKPPK